MDETVLAIKIAEAEVLAHDGIRAVGLMEQVVDELPDGYMLQLNIDNEGMWLYLVRNEEVRVDERVTSFDGDGCILDDVEAALRLAIEESEIPY